MSKVKRASLMCLQSPFCVISSVQKAFTKVKAMTGWPTPCTAKELQKFLGLSNFFRLLIRGFGTTEAPLPAVLKKWEIDCKERGTERFFLQAFTSAPILHHPDPTRPFIVDVDASEMGVFISFWAHLPLYSPRTTSRAGITYMHVYTFTCTTFLVRNIYLQEIGIPESWSYVYKCLYICVSYKKCCCSTKQIYFSSFVHVLLTQRAIWCFTICPQKKANEKHISQGQNLCKWYLPKKCPDFGLVPELPWRCISLNSIQGENEHRLKTAELHHFFLLTCMWELGP